MKALITGVTRGIGRAIALQLANDGFEIVGIARNEKDLLELKNQLELERKLFTGHAIDLGNQQNIESNALVFKTHFDVIVHNAGLYVENEILNLSTFETQLQINFKQVVQLNQYLIPSLIEHQKGQIFIIGSVVATQARSTASAYSASKAALANYAQSLANECRKHQIKVTHIQPGSVNTSSWDVNDTSLPLIIQPKDIALMISAAIKLSAHAWIENITLKPLNQ
jgi:short-subunit dehydrogenase